MTLDDLERRIQGLPTVFKYPLLSQVRESYGLQISPVHSHGPSEQKPIKNFGEKGAWASETALSFKYPLLSQERLKLPTSDFVRTVIRSITTKAH